MTKERLDVILVKRELVETREKAKRLIMAGLVFSENERLDKPGMKFHEDIPLTLKGQMPYVGRGGYKIEKALQEFALNVADKIVVDIGASTGGFTDCVLQNDAKLVYAIDVGYNQLAWKLRSDPRVIVMEKTNFRYVTIEMFNKGLPQFAMIDVSFISLRFILPVLKRILQPNSHIVALIKPQFEAGRDEVGSKGVIRDKTTHQSVLNNIISFAQNEEFSFLNISYSPITGNKGNIEYLAHLGWHLESKQTEQIDIKQAVHDVVDHAHNYLSK